MYRNSMAASVCNRQNVTRVSMAFVEENNIYNNIINFI